MFSLRRCFVSMPTEPAPHLRACGVSCVAQRKESWWNCCRDQSSEDVRCAGWVWETSSYETWVSHRVLGAPRVPDFPDFKRDYKSIFLYRISCLVVNKDILGYSSVCSVLKECYNIWYKVNLENEISFTQEFARLKTVVWKKCVGGCELVIWGIATAHSWLS